MEKNYFTELNTIDVNEHTEKKGGLTYLSWAWAWAEIKKAYPDAQYKVYENSKEWNYFTDDKTGWVKTGVIVNGIEHIEYLPIMDFKNKSIPVDAITSFDVNKTIQRSLTKACARHGLGLYIYAGEDLPEGAENQKEMITQEQINKLKELGASEEGLCKTFNVSNVAEMTFNDGQKAIALKTAKNTFPDAKITIKKEGV